MQGKPKLKIVNLLFSRIWNIGFLLAVRPPELLVWINLFALAGQEALFFAPILFGLYWKKQILSELSVL